MIWTRIKPFNTKLAWSPPSKLPGGKKVHSQNHLKPATIPFTKGQLLRQKSVAWRCRLVWSPRSQGCSSNHWCWNLLRAKVSLLKSPLKTSGWTIWPTWLSHCSKDRFQASFLKLMIKSSAKLSPRCVNAEPHWRTFQLLTTKFPLFWTNLPPSTMDRALSALTSCWASGSATCRWTPSKILKQKSRPKCWICSSRHLSSYRI